MLSPGREIFLNILHSQIMDNTIRFMRANPILPTPLFRSDRQAAILSTLFFSIKRISIFDLATQLEIPYPSIHREISRLLKAGILEENKVGNTSLLSANQRSPFYRPQLDLLEVTSGPIPLLRNSLGGIPGIENIYLFGSWAHRILGKDGPIPNDVDVIVIGDPDIQAVYKACKEVGRRIGWEVNPVIMSEFEWSENTPFLQQVKQSGFIPVIEPRDGSE